MSEQKSQSCVLVVESDLIVRQPLAEYLRECGYKVFEANDSDEAKNILNDSFALIDVMLCDVRIPGSLDGFGLSRWVREQNLRARVILAGSVERAVQKAGDLCEDGPLLSKPYEHAALIGRIKIMLAKRDSGIK